MEQSPAAEPRAPEPPGPQVPGAPAGVRTAAAVLEGLAQRPLSEHVAGYDEVHRLLRDALATLDQP